MSRVVLIGADAALEHQSRTLLGDDAVVLPPASPERIVTRVIWLDRRPELILFGGAMPTQLALAIVREVRELADVIGLVTDDPQVMEEARRIGASEFLPPGADLEAVDALFERAREQVSRVRGIEPRGPVRAPGRVVVVISPKGGVGKTTIAVNLAAALARREPGEVVIVDLDLQFGDVATLVGVEPRHSVVDALGKAAARDDFVLRTFLVEHPSGFAVLGAPENPAAADQADPRRVGHLLRQLAASFRHVIVDTSPGLGEHTLSALEQATAIVAVAGADVPSVRGLRKSLEVLRELELLPGNRTIVLNGVDRSIGLTVADAEHMMGANVDVAIPHRRRVALAGNRGVPVVESHPRDIASRSIRIIARRLDDGSPRRVWRDEFRKEKVS